MYKDLYLIQITFIIDGYGDGQMETNETTCIGLDASMFDINVPTDKPNPSTTSAVKEIPKDLLSSLSCRYLMKNGYLWPRANSIKKLCATTLNTFSPTCTPQALGLKNGDIPDSSITASSFTESLYRPEQGRLHYKGDGGSKNPAWEPSKPLKEEWIQVDLGKEMTVTGVATQGNGKRVLQEWVTTYILQYSNDGDYFEDYENGRAFDGNNDRDSVKKNRVDPPIQARFIRLMPKSWHDFNALRMELYGCSKDVLINTVNSTCVERPLGMQNGAIPDYSIIASSFYHSRYSPHEARLHNQFNGLLAPGSWCVHFNQTGSWIQVDLGTVTEVTGIATQGKVPNPTEFSAYTTSYKLKYSNDGKVFTEYLKGVVLVGNTDWNTVVKNDLVPVINARYIRIYPQTWHRHIALRVELYGCKTGN